jgi:hypothetical protein
MSEASGVYSAIVKQMNQLQDENARLRAMNTEQAGDATWLLYDTAIAATDEVVRLRAGLREVRTILATGRTVGHNWQVNALIAENRIIEILEDEHEDHKHPTGLHAAGSDTSMG